MVASRSKRIHLLADISHEQLIARHGVKVRNQGKSEGIESWDRPSNLIQIGLK